LNGTGFPFSNFHAKSKLVKKLSVTEILTNEIAQSYEKLRTQETAVIVEKDL
jgi:hypothetical protein